MLGPVSSGGLGTGIVSSYHHEEQVLKADGILGYSILCLENWEKGLILVKQK
jgi:hypothetical protein